MRMVSRPTRGSSRRWTASWATSRTVQRARPLGGSLADHGDDALALLVRKQACRTGPLLVVARTFEPALLIAPGEMTNRLPCHGQDFGDRRRAHSFGEPQQSHRAHRHADLLDAAA